MKVGEARVPSFLALEALWAFALTSVTVRVLSGGEGDAPSLAAVAAVVAGSWLVVRSAPGGSMSARTLVAVAASGLALFLILHTEYAAADQPWRLGWVSRLGTEPRELLAGRRYVVDGIVALTLLWLLGVVRWSRAAEAPDVLATATFGFGIIALAALIDPRVHGPHPFGALALAYFLLAWWTLILYQTADPDEPLRTVVGRWGAPLGVIMAAAAIFVFTLSAIDPGTLGFLATPGRAVMKVLGVVAIYTLGPVAGAIAWVFGLIPLHRPHQQEQMQQPAPPPMQEPHGDTPAWLRIAAYVFTGGAITTLALSFAAIVWLAVRRRTRGQRPQEQRRSVEREGGLAQDLGDLLDGIANRLRRGGGRDSGVEIRRLYHQMLTRAEKDGLVRPPAATPTSFAPLLDARYGSQTPSVISATFVRSRYGLEAIEGARVRELREQWHVLLREGAE